MALMLSCGILRAQQPVILVPPESQTVPATFTATFGVDISSQTAFGYQWYFNNQAITNATNHILNIVDARQTNAGTYYVNVTNTCCSAQSSPVTLTVTNVPVMVSNIQFTTLASLNNSTSGAVPQSGVIESSDGYLYGTTALGGNNNAGTVYKINTNGTFAWTYSFTDGTDGANPVGGLVQTPDSNLYGTAELGGSYGFGTVFRITTNGTLNTIYSFLSGNAEGAYPQSSLCLGSDGFLYGSTVTNTAGAQGGDIFKMDTNGNIQWSYALAANNGLRPLGALTQGTDGNFYGTTSVSSSNNFGSVFVISPAGNFTNLYAFAGAADGAYPRAGLVQGADGQFYGTTTQGGNLALNGGLGYGTVFKITSAGALTPLFAFDVTNGDWPQVSILGGLIVQPEGGLILARDGNFYGMAASGGIAEAYDDTNAFPAIFGTIFQLTPTGTFTTLLSFNGSFDGATPRAVLWQGRDDSLYGTTSNGGTNDLATGGDGTIFSLGLARPAIQPPHKAGATFSFTWNSFINEPYQLQYKDNLSQPAWVNFGAPVIGTNGIDGESDIIGATNLHRFYRVWFDF
jgi:uncharacterized repeat protein (TIGR03803 family)